MNSITIAGNLTRDAEVKHIPSGEAVLQFSVADSQGGQNKPVIFWNCSIWGKRAESALSQYLLKGQTVTVSGALTKREWTDKEGNKREALDLRVADVALQGGKRESQQEAPQARPAARPEPRHADRGDSGFDDLDVPF